MSQAKDKHQETINQLKLYVRAVNKSEASPSDLKFKENPTDINCALVYTCRLSKRGYLLNI